MRISRTLIQRSGAKPFAKPTPPTRGTRIPSSLSIICVKEAGVSREARDEGEIKNFHAATLFQPLVLSPRPCFIVQPCRNGVQTARRALMT
jgi:hypothetical protein